MASPFEPEDWTPEDEREYQQFKRRRLFEKRRTKIEMAVDATPPAASFNPNEVVAE